MAKHQRGHGRSVHAQTMRFGSGVDQLRAYAYAVAAARCTLPSTTCATPSAFAISRRFRFVAAFVLHHRSATDDFQIRDLGQIRLGFHPGCRRQSKRSLFSLRFSNGSTAMLLSGAARSIARDNGKTLRCQRRLPRARATQPSSPPSAFARCASSGPGTFLAVADCPLDPRKGSRSRHAFRVLLRIPKIMQQRPPMFVFFQIFGDVFGDKNVSGVAAIHHPLRHVKAGTGEIGRPFTSITPLTGPLCTPIRSCRRGCALRTRLISIAHCAGAS